MGYHSVWNGYEEQSLLGCGVYPIKYSSTASSSGPAPRMEVAARGEGQDGTAADDEDIIDEALYYFKPNMLFRTFAIKGCGDRTILYLTMYLNQCLKAVVGKKRDAALAALLNLANESFPAPGESGFPYSSFFPASTGDAEIAKWKELMRQMRLEANIRLLAKVFAVPEADGTGNKFWMIFAKSTFLVQK